MANSNDLRFWPTPTRRADEPVSHYGARVLAYLIADDGYGFVDDAGLDLADAAAAGMATADLAPATRERLSETRHRIARVLKSRHNERRAAESAAPAPAPAGPSNDGPMAPLAPAPRTNPPAGAYAGAPAKPDIAF